MSLNIQIVTPDAFPWTVSGAIADRIRASKQDRFSLALSGGRTVRPIFEALSEIDLPWERLDLFQTDERAVGIEDRESNYRTIQEGLVKRLPSPPRTLNRMEAERPDLGAAAEDYAGLLPDRLDLALVGIGEDGHVCSIFPGQDSLWREPAKVVPSRAPSGDARLTMTPAYLNTALHLIVVASGPKKAAAVSAALQAQGTEFECPARLARRGHWVVDQAASHELRYL